MHSLPEAYPGRRDPWKALEVRWDQFDTPANVPVRVSPWEVSPVPTPSCIFPNKSIRGLAPWMGLQPRSPGRAKRYTQGP